MKRSVVVAAAVLAAGAVGAACGGDGQAEERTPEAAAPAAVLGASDVAVATRTQLLVGVPVSGTLEPGVDVRIKSPVPEVLDAVLVKEGEAVAAGQVLARFRQEQVEAAALSAEAKSVPNGLAAVSALLFWSYVLDRLGHRWPWFQRLLEPAPLPIVRDGKPIRENLDAEGITDEELKAQLRENGIDEVSRVKLATVESDGSVSVVPKDDCEPPGETPAALARARSRASG